MIQAHKDHNIVTVMKHFPGHGSSTTDSHLGITDVSKTWNLKELKPYWQLIDSGYCEAVMTAHVINEHLDSRKYPSTLSKAVVGDLLRGFLRFNGVVFSDDMQMQAITDEFGLEKAIYEGIEAGLDVLMFANNVNKNARTSAAEVHQIIKSLVEQGKVSEERIDSSFQRIMTMKSRF